MKKISFLCLAIVLIMAIILPATAYGGKPGINPNASEVEIVKKVSVRGVPSMGPPSSGPKPYAATGIIGKEVRGTRYAIIIGISDYPGPNHVLEGGYDLSYSDDDAVTMKEVLINDYYFEEPNVHLLVNTEATRNAILNKIANLKGRVSPDDEVVFFFSGHGAKYTPEPMPAQGGGRVGIVTWGEEVFPLPGFGYVWDKELNEAFSGFKAEKIVFIFDSCLAGGMIELGEKGRVICMATTQTGVAVEYGEDYAGYYDGGQLPLVNHGLFTYFLVELGMIKGLADSYPTDDCVTVEEAFDFARFNLEGMSKEIPELWQVPTIHDGFVNDLLF